MSAMRMRKLLVGLASLAAVGAVLFSSCTALIELPGGMIDVDDDEVKIRLPGLSVDVDDDDVKVRLPGIHVDVDGHGHCCCCCD